MNAEQKRKYNRPTIPNLGLIYVGLTVKPVKREKWCVKLLLRHLSSELCLVNCVNVHGLLRIIYKRRHIYA